MHLIPKKRIEVYSDSKTVVLRDDLNNQSIHITANGNNFELINGASNPGSTSGKTTYLIWALYGLVELVGQSYLVVVTKAEFAANIAGRNIYFASEFKFIGLGLKDTLDDQYAIAMFERFFLTNSFYFTAIASQYDLTLPFSTNADRSFASKVSDERFYYNHAFVKRFLDRGLHNWVQPFICGLVAQRVLTVNNKTISFTLLSRRDRTRAGMRFISRGSDINGNVSNFAETEQLLSFNSENGYEVFSYLQTRGSIPLLWKQTPTLKWSPAVMIETNTLKNKTAFENHMNRLKALYGSNYLINLIDKKGTQKRIGDHFTELLKAYNDKSSLYTWFDFHGECKNMKWENLSRLLTHIAPQIKDYNYGHFKVPKQTTEDEPVKVEPITHQKGVFRTNCMDCLDRTNVVQSVIARNILLSQLCKAGLIQKPNGDVFEHLPGDLEETFREFWTENADRLSMLYSGTGALKVDFTRTGKRSKMGAIEDGKRAILRYVYNNFYDSYNQNALDLVLGKIKAEDLNGIAKLDANSTLMTAGALLVAPYFISSFFLTMFGKNFGWGYFFFLISMSMYMAYSYLTVSSRKLWNEQIIKS